MNKEDYASIRDEFARAYSALEAVQQTFLDGVDYDFLGGDDDTLSDYDLARGLDNAGYWLTGDEYREVVDGLALLERLVGRASLRAA